MSEPGPMKLVCDELSIPYTTAKSALYRGEIPYQRIGRGLYVTRESVLAWWKSPRAQIRRCLGRYAVREQHGDDEHVSIKYACDQLGISYSNVLRVVREGRIPSVREGRMRLVRVSDVKAWQDTPRNKGGKKWSSAQIPAGKLLHLECGRQVVVGIDEQGLPYPVPPEYLSL